MSDTMTLKVPGMTCGHCEAAVGKAVGALDAVQSVNVDLATKLVTITGTGLDRAAIVAAIDDAGYDVDASGDAGSQ